MNWPAHVEALLREAKPASVCALDPAALELAAAALPDLTIQRYHESEPPRCVVALGVDALNGLAANAIEQLIGRIRTYSAQRLLLVAHAGCALDEAGFRALGFVVSLVDVETGTRVYDYDIDTYKSVPDWLNARFWAHPERWEP
ncbi:conserved hypothetical protein [Thiobacillus denitrificans ATCC 25259]|uniref:Uncharacterized protein n=1 Tax=Thiobacillus denitrificans (strain ATCC 25259 / T1) TaxID=292415 RepID=Q3SHD7_THIDA|nr:DUF6231 family protein [Thiobacillus denitrificans]AAZ97949.1 conserved hypothetical protein [Thiobacillus denitrificans ATCC 25259]